jgi:hypothetical protein
MTIFPKVVPSQSITEEDLASARSHHSEGTDDRGFWDAESRVSGFIGQTADVDSDVYQPVEWGQDSAIATAVKVTLLLFA